MIVIVTLYYDNPIIKLKILNNNNEDAMWFTIIRDCGLTFQWLSGLKCLSEDINQEHMLLLIS